MLAFCGKWQPKQLGFHDEWQAMQFMFYCRGPGTAVLPGTSPQTNSSFAVESHRLGQADLAL